MKCEGKLIHSPQTLVKWTKRGLEKINVVIDNNINNDNFYSQKSSIKINAYKYNKSLINE